MDLMISLQGVDDFLAYFLAALLAEGVFVLVYMKATPHHEARLIKAGNAAAAISLGGAILGFTLPLASAIANSVSILDMAVWALVALIAQIAAFLVVGALLRGLSRRIDEGNLAAAITLATASIAIGVLNAASMTY